MEKNDFNQLKYFLECYFHTSMDFAELIDAINEFKTKESLNHVSALKQDVMTLVNQLDWPGVQDFVSEYGERHLSIEDVKQMFDLLSIKL